jgi:hypothetical protein
MDIKEYFTYEELEIISSSVESEAFLVDDNLVEIYDIIIDKLDAILQSYS